MSQMPRSDWSRDDTESVIKEVLVGVGIAILVKLFELGLDAFEHRHNPKTPEQKQKS